MALLEFYGGAEGDRTPDLVIANDALSQLSYCPEPGCFLEEAAALVKGMTRASAIISSRRPDMVPKEA